MLWPLAAALGNGSDASRWTRSSMSAATRYAPTALGEARRTTGPRAHVAYARYVRDVARLERACSSQRSSSCDRTRSTLASSSPARAASSRSSTCAAASFSSKTSSSRLDLGADVAAGVEAEALLGDLREARDSAEAVDVGVVVVGKSVAEQLIGARRELGVLAAVQADDVHEELDLLVGELAVRAVDLAKDAAGVDEQHRVGALGARLATVEEPQRDRQRHRVEEVRADGDHDIDDARLDELAADLRLAVARVGGRVGHDEPGAAAFVERRREELDPDV
jgi:hypothetical protein